MPIIPLQPRTSGKKYTPPPWLRNGHVHTMFPYLFGQSADLSYSRKRIDTHDGDFIDLDFSIIGSQTLLIALHGLEGNSQSIYIKSLVKFTNQHGWDIMAVNHRGCSGEPNRLYSAYHSGKTDDLDEIIRHVEKEYSYENIILAGFSLGGNITLKYLGEKGANVSSRLKAAVAISVPCDLAASSKHLSRPKNRLYLNRFLKSLKEKAIVKKLQFPDAPFSITDVNKTKDFDDYDNLYTAPAHGFKDAMDYWQRCSSKNFLSRIRLPTLLIQALDDPFLPMEAHPFDEAKASSFFHLLAVKFGGHVGFINRKGLKHPRWHEEQLLQFARLHLTSVKID